MAAQVLVGLRALGHRVRALASITVEAAARSDPFALAHPDIAVTRYPVPGFPSSFPRASLDEGYRRAEGLEIGRLLTALITQEPPDVVLVGLEGLVWHVLPITEAHRIPSLQIIHGSFALRALLDGIADTDRLIPHLRTATRIVAVAHHLAKRLQPLGLDHIRVIPNPVDLARFRPGPKPEPLLREFALTPDHVVVLHASHLRPLKRPLDLVASAVRAVHEDPRLVYVIVGGGQWRAGVEEACRARRLDAHFRFVGRFVEHACMPDFFNLADMVVVSSETEGQSLVSLETQACARLLVASDIPAAREIVAHGKTGLLFRMGDVDDLAAKTLLAARDPRLRETVARQGRARVEAHALPTIVARYASALREAAQRGHGAATARVRRGQEATSPGSRINPAGGTRARGRL